MQSLRTTPKQLASTYFRRRQGGILIALLLSLFIPCAAAQLYRPQQEKRTVTAETFEILVQKNGQIDVNLRNEAPVIDNAYPAIQLQGQKLKSLPIEWRRTARTAVSDALGQGQGFVYAWQNCEWHINTYPTQPFFTVRAVFVNTGSTPVYVERLSPWATDPRKGGFSVGGFGEEVLFQLLADAEVPTLSTNLVSPAPLPPPHAVVLQDVSTGRNLIFGMLGAAEVPAQFVVEAPQADKEWIRGVRVELVFAPPVEVAPGERLSSPLLYIAVAESDLTYGLRRLVAARRAMLPPPPPG